jgi:hypothetical protein
MEFEMVQMMVAAGASIQDIMEYIGEEEEENPEKIKKMLDK